MRVKPKDIQAHELDDVFRHLLQVDCQHLMLLGSSIDEVDVDESFHPDRVIRIVEPVSDLSSTLLQLSNLTTLHIKDISLLDQDVQSIMGLASLSCLELNEVSLTLAQVEMLSQCQGLQTLNLDGNFLGNKVLAIISRLPNLHSLSLSDNELDDAGMQHVLNLKKLTEICLEGNNLSQQGVAYLAQLPQLKSVNLHANQVEAEGVSALSHLRLERLNLDVNPIGAQGVQYLSTMRELKSLSLNECAIGDEGLSHLSDLTQLEYLSLKDNTLSDSGVVHLSNLTRLLFLDLDDNDISDEGVYQLTSLQRLKTFYLRNNNINNQGVEYLADFNELESLDLRGTLVSDIEPLSALKVLKSLSLSGTNVFDLRPLKNLIINCGVDVHWAKYCAGIAVKDCPLTCPPPDVIASGMESTKRYFQAAESEGLIPLLEAKVVVLAEQAEQAQSFIESLYPQQLSVASDNASIQRFEYEFDVTGGYPYRINFWCFNERCLYEQVYPLALSENTLYVLLYERKDEQEESTFYDYLVRLQQLSPYSPIIVIQNTTGKLDPLNEEALQQAYPEIQVLHTYGLGGQDSGLLGDLRADIEYYMQALPHIGYQVPVSSLDVRQLLENSAHYQTVMSLQEYLELYRQCCEGRTPFDSSQAMLVLQHLHDVGDVIYLQDEDTTKDMIFLQVQSLFRLIFNVLDDQYIQSNQGCFTVADCRRCWGTLVSAELYIPILKLMEKFDLCYQKTDTQQWCLLSMKSMQGGRLLLS